MLDLPGEVLILTGTPGSGKTTAARSLAAQAGAPKVHLHCDDFWRFLAAGAIEPWRPGAHAQNAVVMDAVAATAAAFAAGGYFVVVDGIVGPWFLQPFRDTGMPTHYAVLRPALEEAVARCRQRGGDTLHDADTITMLHAQFADLRALERHALSVDGLDPAGTVAAIASALLARTLLLED